MDDNTFAPEPPTFKERLRERLRHASGAMETRAGSIENGYLSLVRYSLLVFATGAILVAVWSVISGAIRQLGSTDVDPVTFAIAPREVAPPEAGSGATRVDDVRAPRSPSVSDALRNKTLQTYRVAFASFERTGENASADQIIATVWPKDRLAALEAAAASTLVTGPDGKPVSSGAQLALLAVETVGGAAATPGFKTALQNYRTAKKVRVCEFETRTRRRTISTWDEYSTSCSAWYIRPYGCPATETVSEPYSERVCKMQFPEDLESPAEAMANAVGRYLTFAAVRTEQAQNDALDRAGDIAARKLRGRERLRFAGQVF